MSMKVIGEELTFTTLTGIQRDDIQPNAIDLRLGKVLLIEPNLFEIDETKKVHRGSVEMLTDDEGYYNLQPGHYEVVMENEINVARGEAGWVITRSTLNRNGVFLTSGLYDSGYHGVMAAVMHVSVAPMRIKKGTRIGQYLCFEAETVGLYNGSYGKGKAHDEKYK